MPWWNQRLIAKAKILLVGVGGIGSTIALPLIQQGVGWLDMVDPDRVEQTNRSRQFYTSKDVGKYKAHALPTRLWPFATGNTTIRGIAARYQDAVLDTDHDLIICGVDNDATNISVTARAHRYCTPAVFVNVSKDGEACRIFLQQRGKACFACYKPAALIPKPPAPCIPTPAIVDILHIAAGLAVRAATSLLLREPIGPYNCRDLTMSGINLTKTVPRRSTCPVCQHNEHPKASIGIDQAI